MNITQLVPSKWYYGIREYGDTKYTNQRKKKPCYLGDNVHLHNRNGVYHVVDVDYYCFTTQTRNGNTVRREWRHFKCLAGGHWNVTRTINYYTNRLDI